MSDKWRKNGFTLIEILIALTLIAAILSMVYGSYFATSRSTHVCQARINMCRQGRTALDQMARQIRCAYAGTAKDEDLKESSTQQERIVREDGADYFTGSRDASNGEISADGIAAKPFIGGSNTGVGEVVGTVDLA